MKALARGLPNTARTRARLLSAQRSVQRLLGGEETENLVPAPFHLPAPVLLGGPGRLLRRTCTRTRDGAVRHLAQDELASGCALRMTHQRVSRATREERPDTGTSLQLPLSRMDPFARVIQPAPERLRQAPAAATVLFASPRDHAARPRPCGQKRSEVRTVSCAGADEPGCAPGRAHPQHRPGLAHPHRARPA